MPSGWCSVFFGLLNVAVAPGRCGSSARNCRRRRLAAHPGVAAFALLVAFAGAGELTSPTEETALRADEIVTPNLTPYQRIVVTRWKDDLSLHLNNNLQFRLRDEYRFSPRGVVHPGLGVCRRRRVLVLRWRRQAGRTRDFRARPGRIGDAGRSRPGDDAPVLDRTGLHWLNEGGARRRR